MSMQQPQPDSDSLQAFLDAAKALAQKGSLVQRATAVSVLGTLGTENDIAVLLHVLEVDESRQVQHKASQAIARIGGHAAIEGLQNLMRSQNQYTRFLAAEALAGIVSKGTI